MDAAVGGWVTLLVRLKMCSTGAKIMYSWKRCLYWKIFMNEIILFFQLHQLKTMKGFWWAAKLIHKERLFNPIWTGLLPT